MGLVDYGDMVGVAVPFIWKYCCPKIGACVHVHMYMSNSS